MSKKKASKKATGVKVAFDAAGTEEVECEVVSAEAVEPEDHPAHAIEWLTIDELADWLTIDELATRLRRKRSEIIRIANDGVISGFPSPHNPRSLVFNWAQVQRDINTAFADRMDTDG